LNAYDAIGKIAPSANNSSDLNTIADACRDALNDDFNTAIVIAQLFELTRIVNSAVTGAETLTADGIAQAKNIFETYLFGILGVKREEKSNTGDVEGLMKLIIDIRALAKSNKDFATSDKLRDELGKLGISIKDGKDGTTWTN
jgi:cysteinyl-tRNA synthetase